MQKTTNVDITIMNTQTSAEGSSCLRENARGSCSLMGDTWYLAYRTSADDGSELKNLIKARPGWARLVMSGSIDRSISLEPGKRTVSVIGTPAGELVLGFTAKSVSVREKQGGLQIILEYSIDACGDKISDDHVEVLARPRP